MSPDKLVRMANQIAGFFETGADGDPALAVAKHINDFWDPRMRKQLHQIAADSTAALHPLVVKALPQVGVPA